MHADPGRRFAADTASLCPGLICDGHSGRKTILHGVAILGKKRFLLLIATLIELVTFCRNKYFSYEFTVSSSQSRSLIELRGSPRRKKRISRHFFRRSTACYDVIATVLSLISNMLNWLRWGCMSLDKHIQAMQFSVQNFIDTLNKSNVLMPSAECINQFEKFGRMTRPPNEGRSVFQMPNFVNRNEQS